MEARAKFSLELRTGHRRKGKPNKLLYMDSLQIALDWQKVWICWWRRCGPPSRMCCRLCTRKRIRGHAHLTSAKKSDFFFLIHSHLVTYINQLVHFLLAAFWVPPPPPNDQCGGHMFAGPLGRVARQDEQGRIQLRPRGEEKIRRESIFCCRLGKANRACSLALSFVSFPRGNFSAIRKLHSTNRDDERAELSAPCSKEESKRLLGKVSRWQNLIPSFPWIVPGWRAWGRNPRKGRDQILLRSVAEP